MIVRLPLTLALLASCALPLTTLSIARAAEPAAAKVAAPHIKPFGEARALPGTGAPPKAEPGKPPTTTVFNPTAGESAVVETMAPGTEMEMTNVYAKDDTGAVTLTHYCHMG